MADEPPEEFDKDAVGEPEEFDPELARELSELLESDQFGELADDILLDEVGRGEDHRTIYDEISETEWELQDHLADIHEQPDDEPIPELVSVDEAAKIIAEAKKKREEEQAAAQKRAQGQGDEKMAISDDAQQVMQIAGDETASQAMEGAIRALEDAVGALNAAEGHLSTVGQNMQAAGEAAASQASQAGGLLGGDDGQTVSAQGQAVGQAVSDALSKIADIDISGALQNVQAVDLSSLSEQIQGLREAIKSAARKHL